MTDTPSEYLLRLRGEGMMPTLQPDDELTVKQQDHAENGQIVIAKIGDEYTVRRFGEGALVPDNHLYERTTEGFEIVGLVLSYTRSLV